ncbi:MAG TPA: T9SS type A sorting domain-containing protein, partial [Desulfomonilaceae bacterium]|nr:T9SS type A sorting domain-containing protein [Desulfomonilaceae bacterium]
NYPNPFNPRTDVRYLVPGVSDVKIAVYDVLGREVAVLVNERKQPGSYKAVFDASGLASGVYLYRMTAGSFVESQKMLLLK